jgi:uncharacterized protein YbaP (TraB family)
MLALAAAVSLASIGPAAAQDGDAQNAIVVTARLSGAPTWTIKTERGTIILVGELFAVPKSTPWLPDRLEAATERAQRVILGTKPSISLGDIFRVIFKGGKLTRLPKGKVAADYLDSAQRRRLAALEAQYKQDYSRKSFLITSFDLLTKRIGFNRHTGDDASDVVRRAARHAGVPAQPVGTVRGKDMLDSLFEAPPESHLPCLDASMRAAEEGPDLVEQRGLDWRAFDVRAVMANPLEQALGRCWPWADEDVGNVLRGQWIEAIDRAAGDEGVTLGVAPLQVLAEKDGILDQLKLKHFDIHGPAWR